MQRGKSTDDGGLAEYFEDQLGRTPKSEDYTAAEGETTVSHQIRRQYLNRESTGSSGQVRLHLVLKELIKNPIGVPNETGDQIAETTAEVTDGEWAEISGDEGRYRVCVHGIQVEEDKVAVSVDRWSETEQHWVEMVHQGWAESRINHDGFGEERLEWFADSIKPTS